MNYSKRFSESYPESDKEYACESLEMNLNKLVDAPSGVFNYPYVQVGLFDEFLEDNADLVSKFKVDVTRMRLANGMNWDNYTFTKI